MRVTRDIIRLNSEKNKVTKAAGIVGSATLLSRIFGFVRDIVFAAFFGAGFHSDAFIAAFRIPNLLRRLFAEGTLIIAFIPVFTEYLKKGGKEEAFVLARSAFLMLLIILSSVIILGVVLSPAIIKGIAYGFTDSPEKFEITVLLTRIVLPYALFISFVALCMGILNALDHFAAPALAPVLLNLAMIASIFIGSLLSSDPTIHVIGLAVGVLVGGVLQLFLQVPFLIRKGFSFFKRTVFIHPGLKKIGNLMLPAIVGAGVYQINILIGTFLGSLLPEGSISYLYYADRLVQFPLGIFALSIATAVLPSLSRQASAKDFAGLKNTFSYALKLILYVMLPSMAGLIVLREPIVSLLFQRGAFDHEAVRMTSDALLYYGVGIWATASVSVVVRVFYSLHDSKIPVTIAVVSIVSNIILSIILMRPMAHSGLALATSLASILNLALLVLMLRIKLGALGWRNIIFSAGKSALAALVMGIAVWYASGYMVPIEHKNQTVLAFGLVGSVFIGLVTYIVLSIIVKSSEFRYVLAMMRKGGLKA